MNWDDLRLLLAVARRGSFLRAGEALGMAASTLSRRITQLEAGVGAALVERGADGTRLTARGEALVQAAKDFETALAPSPEAGGLSGRVRVTAGEGFVAPLTDISAEFTALYPGCTVDLSITADLVKLTQGASDVAIRTLHLGEPSLIYQRLTDVEFRIFAAPKIAARPGLRPETLPMIGLLPPLDQLPHMKAARAAGFGNIRIRVSSFTAQLAAVQRGHGAAALPCALASDLVEPFSDQTLPGLEVFLVTRPQSLRQPQIRAFVDLLKNRMLPKSHDY
ncbi:LysR family transcriptional regulator [Xinfangfangia sp. D13-10-4-6]|uniref:LysR family transcriptional regulator n=1 Tax=Pseudogemmobacter hezensis TaxID=2737662 RepID=UPI001553D8A6|nr:LysR family transcriptional regulator [Pseudogemmobacter hezensis]NPD16704.1 LysR family transcriptional regulator [Pseudogemmobacter hezensis]